MHFPYVSITDGKIVVDLDRKNDIHTFPATEEGARAAGELCRSTKAPTVQFSSSVDFPTENGAPDLDYQKLMTTIHFEANPLSILDLIYMAMQRSIDDNHIEGIAVSQDNDNDSGTIIFDVLDIEGAGSWILSSNDIRETDPPDFS